MSDGPMINITVKLFATLRNGRDKIINMEISQDSLVMDVINRLGIDKSEIAILLINGRDGKVESPLMNGDLLALFPPVGGG